MFLRRVRHNYRLIGAGRSSTRPAYHTLEALAMLRTYVEGFSQIGSFALYGS